MVVAYAQGPGYHLLVPIQYMGGGPLVKGFRGCGLAVGGKQVYSGVPAEASFRECFAGMTFLPKEVNIGWDHLMHAIGVGVESLQPLSVWGREAR